MMHVHSIYLWGFCSYVQKQGLKLDMLTILYVNSINCLPILVVIALAIGEFPRLMTYAGWSDPYLYGSVTSLLIVGSKCDYLFDLGHWILFSNNDQIGVCRISLT